MASRILLLLMLHGYIGVISAFPLFVSTWDHGYNCSRIAYEMYMSGTPILKAVEMGISLACELNYCAEGVGPYIKTDEQGHLSLDAMLMDGTTMAVGAVGGLQNIRNAISVARAVLDYSDHTLMVGPEATDFAVEMGFKTDELRSTESNQTWQEWKDRNCQPNFRKNVSPDPEENCGPYNPIDYKQTGHLKKDPVEIDHDTVNTIGIENGHAVVGTSTNGLQYKIPGRVGDSPIPGAGSYADSKYGAAAATGNGDVMLRFLPSYRTVENMRFGLSPEDASKEAVTQILEYYPEATAAVIAANMDGEYGAACIGYETFPYSVMSSNQTEVEILEVTCENALFK